MVTYELEVIQPRWSPPPGTPVTLTAKWQRYLDQLIAHERGHIDHVVANYADVTTAIHGATCETAESAATAAVARPRKFDVDYDNVTNHGLNDGAQFP